MVNLKRYEGYFKDGFMHGNGTFSIEANGDSYTGEFLFGMRHGKVRRIKAIHFVK